jgi:hypothetical protein
MPDLEARISDVDPITTLSDLPIEYPSQGGSITTPWDMRCPPGSHWEWYYPLKIYGHCVTNPKKTDPNINPTKGVHPDCPYGKYWYWINQASNEGRCVTDYMKNCVSYNYKYFFSVFISQDSAFAIIAMEVLD